MTTLLVVGMHYAQVKSGQALIMGNQINSTHPFKSAAGAQIVIVTMAEGKRVLRVKVHNKENQSRCLSWRVAGKTGTLKVR